MWLEAYNIEHNTLIGNKVYKWAKLPEDKKCNPLTYKWLFTVKRKSDNCIEHYKTRLVTGGNRQKQGINFKEMFIPVAKMLSLCILLMIEALDDLKIRQGI